MWNRTRKLQRWPKVESVNVGLCGRVRGERRVPCRDRFDQPGRGLIFPVPRAVPDCGRQAAAGSL